MDISPHILSDITYEELTLVYIAGRIPVIRSDITYEELTPNTFMPGLSQLRCLAPVGHYL